MQPLNNLVCLQPLGARESQLVFTDRLARFVVRATHEKSQVKAGDVVVCPVNSGFEYEGMRIVNERELVGRCAK